MSKNTLKKVYVALSGGVDSSVAAAILKDERYDVVGVYMKTWSPPGTLCPWKEDRKSAMKVAAHLGIAFKTWDFTAEYKERVVDYMIREYARGRTPNPDVMCNREIKFGLFFDRALAERAGYVATGHYARIVHLETRFPNRKRGFQMFRARALEKDQSYFLWTLTQKHLERTLFPIGEFESKKAVREYAREKGIPTAERKDSQGVCFIGPINVREFLKTRISASPGPIKTVTGRKIGFHEGLPFYTIGQRQGIGIGGTGPYYVARKEAITNTLVVAPPASEEELMSKELIATDVHWIGEPPKDGVRIEASIRYRQAPVLAQTKKLKAGSWKLVFDSPIRAITPGQSVVFYDGDRVLGGAIIA